MLFLALYGCQNAQTQQRTLGKTLSREVPFVTVWRVSPADPTVTIPVDPAYTYRYSVEWGDGQSSSDLNGSVTHVYKKAGEYTVKISGRFPHLLMHASSDLSSYDRREGENAAKLIRVVDWGTLRWKSMRNMFAYCANLELDTSSRPDLKEVHSLRNMFYGAGAFDSDINDWNVSSVTDMSGMFYEAGRFNQPLNHWDVSHVKDMSRLFSFAAVFDQPLNDWNVSSVTTMAGMFKGAARFNQPLDHWDVSHVTDMAEMFAYTRSFNQPLDHWDVSRVIRMDGMFRFAKAFHDQDLSRWDVSQVIRYKGFLHGAGSGNALPTWPQTMEVPARLR